MQYFGGKFRVCKAISAYINNLSPKVYLEPFCGSCWVGERVQAERRIFCDLNADLISLYQHLQAGILMLPERVDEAEYARIKTLPSPNPLRAFVGFGCSYSGKFFGGYARGAATRNYAANAKAQLTRRFSARLHAAEYHLADYREAFARWPEADVVYCDPPYAGTTKFYGLPDMDYAAFWDSVRQESARRVVLVSEYSAPVDFQTVLEIPTRTDIRNARGQLEPRIERLFQYRG